MAVTRDSSTCGITLSLLSVEVQKALHCNVSQVGSRVRPVNLTYAPLGVTEEQLDGQGRHGKPRAATSRPVGALFLIQEQPRLLAQYWKKAFRCFRQEPRQR